MDDHQVAYLDWPTGVVRLNATLEDLHAALNCPDLSQLDLGRRSIIEGITHEVTHAIQIATMGFPYLIAVERYALLRDCVKWPVTNLNDLPQIPPSHVAEQLEDRLVALQAPQTDGISDLAVLEGNAVYAQFWTHYRGLNAFQLMEHLTGLPACYSSAFTLCSSLLGTRAFEAFGMLSSLALCTRRPGAAFGLLCRETAKRKLADPRDGTYGYLEMVNDLHVAEHIELVGTAAEVLERGSGHPVYAPIVMELNDLCESDGLSVLDYFAAPFERSAALAAASVRPFALNSEFGEQCVWVPTNWRRDLGTKTDRNAEAEIWILLMSLSQRMLAAVGT
ncbi:MAG: hypothetical protein QM778_18325 [Myxococcales bacterium]